MAMKSFGLAATGIMCSFGPSRLKAAGTAVIMLGCAYGVAQAAAPTPPPEPSQILSHIKRNPDGSLPERGGVIPKGAKRAALVLGWNFFVCTASQVFSPSASSFTVFARNSDGTLFFETTSSASDPVQNELVAACQHAGGGYFLHITDIVSGFFDQVWIFYP